MQDIKRALVAATVLALAAWSLPSGCPSWNTAGAPAGRKNAPTRKGTQPGASVEQHAATRLAGCDQLCVLLDPAAVFDALDDALETKGYGEVLGSDVGSSFLRARADTPQGTITALVAYTDESLIPSGRSFQPMSITQALDATLIDMQAGALLIDPGTPGELTLFNDGSLERLREHVGNQPPLSFGMHVKR